MKRELELYKMVESAAIDERQEHKGSMIKDLPYQLQMGKRLIDEMQRNLDEAQTRSYEVERKLDQVLGEYIQKLMGRPQHIMNKMWQMMQDRMKMNISNLQCFVLKFA